MIRVTEHTRKGPPVKCSSCRGEIRQGDRYRQLIGMDTDIWDKGFIRDTVHAECAHGEEWELRDGRERPRPVVHVPDWPIGSRVILRDDLGKDWRTVTRSKPWNICGHASVLVEGISGSYICSRMRFDTEDVWASFPLCGDRHAQPGVSP